jgi:hypothetical protein
MYAMPEFAVAVILGIVQGITEFLPISSSGHLIITSAFIGDGDPRLKTFEVVIQFGSILAVMLLYRKCFISLLLPKLYGEPRPFSGIRGLFLLLSHFGRVKTPAFQAAASAFLFLYLRQLRCLCNTLSARPSSEIS